MATFSTNKVDPTAQKLRGGYYTPALLTEFLAGWAVRGRNDRILEPSCGDGNFLAAILPMLGANGSITAVELIGAELAKAKRRSSKFEVSQTWLSGDFFEHFDQLQAEAPFDAVLGNPPFIRFQYFESAARERAFDRLRKFGYRPNGLANAWCAFIQLSVELLAEGGRLAMVVPAEILQVGYAAELRARLPYMFDHVTLAGFDELVFPEIQQEVVLILAEGRRLKKTINGSLHTVQIKSAAELKLLNLSQCVAEHLPERHTRSGMKWTSLFLDGATFDILDSVQRRTDVKALSEFASVDVGVVTGRNSFFVMSPEQANEIGVNGYAVAAVGRTRALRSISFSQGDFDSYQDMYPSQMLNLRGIEASNFSSGLKDYIKSGEADGVNNGYKCRMRPRWYDVPSIYVPDAFLFRQIHVAPFLVANHAKATATDTIHRVRVSDGVDVNRLCASSINSLTFAWAEVCGRSYGGGVLELEPREAEELPSLYEFSENLDVDYLDKCLRSGYLEKAVAYSDRILLAKGLGLSGQEINRIQGAWHTLRNRRHGRKNVSATA
jgi:adenine-specific DNA-methyltransferase